SFAAFTDLCLVTFIQLDDEFVHPRSLSRSEDRFRVRLGFETRDVLRHSAAQQFDVLRQVADMTAEHFGRPLVKRTAIEPNLAADRLPHPDQQARKRSLARAGPAEHAKSVASHERER